MKRMLLVSVALVAAGCSDQDPSSSLADDMFLSASGVCYGNTFNLDDAPIAVCNGGYTLCEDYDGGTSDQCCPSGGTCDPSNPEHGTCIDPNCDGKWVTTSGADICDLYAGECPATNDCPVGCLSSTSCMKEDPGEYFYGCVDGASNCHYCANDNGLGGFADLACTIAIEVCECEDDPNLQFGPNCPTFDSRQLFCGAEPGSSCSFQ